jgi:cellulose synthase/poly-beta-1,6-N-acetylglucosamine synthase-like glycosyltransferase
MIRSLAMFIFGLSGGLILYAWIIFPLILFLMWKLFAKTINEISSLNMVQKENYRPIVSIIVAAYNEEKGIAQKIENLLAQDYPRTSMEIIIASDGSQDNTVEIARQYESQGIKVIDYPINRGKASVHNDTAKMAKGEILFFNDVGTILEKDFISTGIKWLSDKKYGCGTGDLTYTYDDDIGRTENIYWKIEKALRFWESGLGILPFVSGGCFFVRKELYEQIRSHGDIDNLLTLSTLIKGFKIFYAKDARCRDAAVSGIKSHFKKRVRTCLRSMGDMFSCFPALWQAKKYGIMFILFSHRVLKWYTGVLMLMLLLANVIIIIESPSQFYITTLIIQTMFYIFTIIGYYAEHNNSYQNMIIPIAKIIYAFFIAMVASTVGIFQLIAGKQITTFKN